ncbi:hypothetical protein COOONC_20643 [Cooperia oncophora]
MKASKFLIQVLKPNTELDEMAALNYKTDDSSGMVFLSGNSHPELSRLVSDRLGIRQGEVIVYNKTNRETSVDIKQSVRGKHVFILQVDQSTNVNNDVMELLILIYACKTSMSKRSR